MEDLIKSEGQLLKELQQLRNKVAKLEALQTIRISERRNSEKALQRSEEKFATAFHCNPDPLSINRFSDGCYVEVNQAFEELTGFNRHEVIGKTAQELDILMEPEKFQQMFKQIREQGSIPSFETTFMNHYGEVRTYIYSMEIIDLDGEPHLLNISKDITDRKRTEEALRLSENFFSKAFNANPIAMTLNTFIDGQVIDINDSFCRIMGSNREKILGRTTKQLDFWVEPADFKNVRQLIAIKGSIRDMEFRFRKANGSIWLGLYSAEKVEINGEICILSLFTDLTAKRQMEIEMSRLDQLNLVGEMAVSIGHEIRNPMTTVRGYLQLLRAKTEYAPEIETIDLMIEELDRTNQIITEFLSLAKNKLVELKPMHLNSVLKTIFPLLESKAAIQDKGLILEMNNLPELLLDENEIRQLVFNLVNNGLESVQAGKNVKIRTYEDNGEVVLAVSDQGQGIDKEILEKLGTPFFTTKEQGTGLGLAICYGIATRHNARIEIDSSSKGTTFYVRFKPLLK